MRPRLFRLRHGSTGHHSNKVGAVFGVGVNVRAQMVRTGRHICDCFGRKVLLERSLEIGGAKHTLRARSGHGDAHARRALGDEDADDRITRGGIAKLLVPGFFRNGERNLGDHFSVFERGFEQSVK